MQRRASQDPGLLNFDEWYHEGAAPEHTSHDHDCHAEGCRYPDGTPVVAGDSLDDNPQGGA